MEEFWNRVDKTETCWLWTGPRRSHGYGAYKDRYAHRVAWTLANGDIPAGMSILHRCDVMLCVNPAHLFIGTQADNMRDKIAKGRAHWQRPGCVLFGGWLNTGRISRFTESDIAEMIAARQAGESASAIGRRLGISQPYVSRIVRGRYTIRRHRGA